MTRRDAAIFVVLTLTGLGGCKSSPNTPASAVVAQPLAATFDLELDNYPTAFEATKDVLREAGFTLDRIDAERGVITTRPRSSAGIFTPWLDFSDSLGGDVENALHAEWRRVRVSVLDQHTGEPIGANGSLDALSMQIEVLRERVQRPHRRTDPRLIRRSSFARESALVQREMQPGYVVPLDRDVELARRLLTEVERRMSESPRRAHEGVSSERSGAESGTPRPA
ncbi:MAG: hypothetical protein AAGD00_03915 [Planctomycetota bacterium]